MQIFFLKNYYNNYCGGAYLRFWEILLVGNNLLNLIVIFVLSVQWISNNLYFAVIIWKFAFCKTNRLATKFSCEIFIAAVFGWIFTKTIFFNNLFSNLFNLQTKSFFLLLNYYEKILRKYCWSEQINWSPNHLTKK